MISSRFIKLLKLLILVLFVYSAQAEDSLESLHSKRAELLKEVQDVEKRIEVAKSKLNAEADEDNKFYKVISVTDGDSLTLLSDTYDKIKIRFQGIDAPEIGQEYGSKAKADLMKITRASGGQVSIERLGKDKYGRTLARVFNNKNEDIGLKLVENGSAWHFKKYSDDQKLVNAHKDAKANKRGLWASEIAPISPDEYRARKKALAQIKKEKTTKKQPQIKVDVKRYWINDNSSNKRHNKGCRWYGTTKRGHYSSNPNEGSACGVCGG